MKTSRRVFLKALGTGSAATCATPFLPGAAAAQNSIRKPFDPRIKQHFLSVCRQCAAGCGVQAEIVNGQVKKLRGNPFHPTNRGTLCAQGIASTQLFYNPDRITGPLRRTGERGAGTWEHITWEEAYQTIADRLTALRSAGKSHTFAVLADQLNGLEGALARRWCQAFGTPNYLELDTYPERATLTAARAMQGLEGPAIFDIQRASFLISFNVPFLDTARNRVQTWKHFAAFRQSPHRRRGHFVHFSPTRDTTAAKADEWIPIRPGTEAAVALGMAYVLLQEGLYDHDFVKFHCKGFTNWRAGGEDLPGFHEHVRRNYKPSRVAELTGVPVDKLVRVAREFALDDAPLALWQEQVGVAAQSLSTQMAIHSLNALVGNIDVPGGVLAPRMLPHELQPAVEPDTTARNGLSAGQLVSAEHSQFVLPETVGSSFAQRVMLGSPYPVECLLVYRANPVFDQLNGAEYGAALAKIPFSVAIAGFHDETTALCDLVLPESHALESWHAGGNYTDDGYPFFNLCEPVVPPRHDTAHMGDMVLEIARRCGDGVAQHFPWKSFPEVAAAYVAQLNERESGDVFGAAYEETWTRLLERIGWRARPQLSAPQFWNACLQAGGWWDPIYYHKEWERSLRAKSGRFEFFPALLWDRLRGFRQSGPISMEEKERILPHFAELDQRDRADEYPFHLLVIMLPPLEGVQSPNQPWLQELTGYRERQHWQTWLDVNPEEAEHHHLLDGGDVWLESPHGQVKLRCRFNPGIQPGTLRTAIGLGHTAGGRWMHDIGAAPTSIIAPAHDPLAGTPNWQATRARIRRA